MLCELSRQPAISLITYHVGQQTIKFDYDYEVSVTWTRGMELRLPSPYPPFSFPLAFHFSRLHCRSTKARVSMVLRVLSNDAWLASGSAWDT
jgi:hypothetical protein